VAAFAQSEREAEMELCCKDVCVGCARTDLWEEIIRDDGYWIHRSTNPNAELPCNAWAIRERWGGKREG